MDKNKEEELCAIEQIERLRDFTVSLNYSIAGFLFKGGEVNDVINILKQMAEDYQRALKDKKNDQS